MRLLEMYMEHANVSTVMIKDLYSPEELDHGDDDADIIAHMVRYDDPKKYAVLTLTPTQLLKLKTPQGDTTVASAFKDYATRDQKNIVKSKIKNFDENRIVVIDGNKLIDGNHHVIAALQLNKNVKAINIK